MLAFQGMFAVTRHVADGDTMSMKLAFQRMVALASHVRRRQGLSRLALQGTCLLSSHTRETAMEAGPGPRVLLRVSRHWRRQRTLRLAKGFRPIDGAVRTKFRDGGSRHWRDV